MNNDIIHVDPRITQYTVYITDNYTGNSIVEENVTGTQFTFSIPDDVLSPMYEVSAWNAGGEGEMSEPVHGCIPRSKLSAGLIPRPSERPLVRRKEGLVQNFWAPRNLGGSNLIGSFVILYVLITPSQTYRKFSYFQFTKAQETTLKA